MWKIENPKTVAALDCLSKWGGGVQVNTSQSGVKASVRSGPLGTGKGKTLDEAVALLCKEIASGLKGSMAYFQEAMTENGKPANFYEYLRGQVNLCQEKLDELIAAGVIDAQS